MVPVNFHQWKQDIRQAILAKAEVMASEWDPFVAAWLCYALSMDEIQNNQPLLNLLERMKRWLEEKDAWSYERNLGPIAVTLWFLKKKDNQWRQECVNKLTERVSSLNADEKLSLLRDSEQVFMLALGIALTENEPTKEHLVRISNEHVKLGPLKRRILYAAALKELDQDITVHHLDPVDEGDILALVWWAERYEDDRRQAWERFSSVAEQIALEPGRALDNQRILTVPEIALLYEAVSRETKNPEPSLLFDYFPFDIRLREVAKEHFMSGKYVSSVFEATKALNELIQELSGIKDKNEVELVQATMKQINNPSNLRIMVNNFLHEESGKNEQAGLALICEGVFKAFRNPKGHKPEDHPLVELDPQEALHQLLVVNFLMIRLKKAKPLKELGYGG